MTVTSKDLSDCGSGDTEPMQSCRPVLSLHRDVLSTFAAVATVADCKRHAARAVHAAKQLNLHAIQMRYGESRSISCAPSTARCALNPCAIPIPAPERYRHRQGKKQSLRPAHRIGV